MFTMICCDEFCCLRCNVGGQRWAVTLPIRDKDLLLFTALISVGSPMPSVAATVSHPLRAWIAGRSLAMSSILAVVSGVGGAVRFLVVGTICQDHHGVSSGWSSVWHCSNTGLSSSQYEQISIILGVWPFCLTPFFFRSITFWRAYG